MANPSTPPSRGPQKPPHNERPAEQPAGPKEPSPVRPPSDPTPKDAPRSAAEGENEPDVEGT